MISQGSRAQFLLLLELVPAVCFGSPQGCEGDDENDGQGEQYTASSHGADVVEARSPSFQPARRDISD
jgi:hypothetical protein